MTEYRPVSQYLLALLLSVALFDDSQLLYALSRPMLVFILLEEEVRAASVHALARL